MEGVHLEQHHSVPAEWPAPMRALTKMSRVLATVEGVAIAMCLAIVVLMLTWQCVDRNVTQSQWYRFPPHWMPAFLHHTIHWLVEHMRVPPWIDGFIRHTVFMLAFFGGAYATYTGRHIRFDAVSRTLKGRRKLILRAFTTAAAIFVVLLFTKAAYGFFSVLKMEAEEASQAGEIFTPARGALIMVFGYALIAFHFFVEWCIDVGWLVSRKEPPSSWVADAGHGGEISGDAPVSGS
jgi:TRAP-type C4-dicarboxylate transport system permease small subunit